MRRTVVRPGETVLVTGAGGGVGLAAIDVAKSLGARVIAVASTEEKRALATVVGAEHAIDPADDVKTRARELTDGQGVDVVYDVVGGDTAEAALRVLRFDGRFCVIGFTGGIPRVPLNLVLLNNRTVVGVEWGGWAMRNPEGNAELVHEVLRQIEAGALHPVAPEERPLDKAGTAIRDLLERARRRQDRPGPVNTGVCSVSAARAPKPRKQSVGGALPVGGGRSAGRGVVSTPASRRVSSSSRSSSTKPFVRVVSRSTVNVCTCWIVPPCTWNVCPLIDDAAGDAR